MCSGEGSSREALWPLLYLPFFLLLVVPFLVGEEYPISPFPMYDQWNPESYLIYFADREGEPVPIQVISTYKAGRYRKMFDNQQRMLKVAMAERGLSKNLSDFGPKEWKPCGIWLLEWIDRNCETGRLEKLMELRPLRVVRRDLRLEDGQVRYQDTVVATDEDREGWSQRLEQE